MDIIIKIENLEKKFNNIQVLKNINFEIKKGEVVCLLGQSGAGKTTLLRCVNFLEKADKGFFVFHNTVYDLSNITKSEINNIRKRTSFVFQNFNLFINKNVLQNVIEGLVVARKIDKNEAIKIGKKMLDKVGLLDKVDYYPQNLSGGQQQRVAIARALATNPDIIYFDEPTSALDPKLTNEVLSIIKELANDGMTMLIVTHEMSFARNISNRILFMDDGMIVEDNTTSSFFDDIGSEKKKQFLQLTIH